MSLSVDPPEVSAAFRAGLGARWTFLADPEREHLDALDLREHTDTVHHPYRPAVFVLPGILGSNLELSNVDVATEFTKLIINQNGYQANSRVITTANTLLQTVISLIQ